MKISKNENIFLCESYSDYVNLNRPYLSDAESAAAKREFRSDTTAYSAGGWLLPDGTFLDFDYPRYIDHSEISKIFSDERNQLIYKKTGPSVRKTTTDLKEEALAAGLIRLQSRPTGVFVTVWQKPTLDQFESLDNFGVDSLFQLNSNFIVSCGVCVRDRYIEYDSLNEFVKKFIPDIKRYTI